MGFFGFLMYMYYLCSQKKNKKEKEVDMKKVINIILLVVLGVSLSGCEWFEHENSNKKNSNKKNGDEVENTSATKLMSYGGGGYIVLIDDIEVNECEEEIDGRWVSKNIVNYKSERNERIPIDIDVQDLDYNPNDGGNIKIGIRGNYQEYNLRRDGEFFTNYLNFDGKGFVMEDVFELEGTDSIFIDFVHREGANKPSEIRDEKWAEQILTSSEIEKIINGEDTTKYEKTYISLSWIPNLSRECYNINGKIYTRRGDRWIYLANQYPPLGYMTSTNETHMIACIKLNPDKNNFADLYKVVSHIDDDHCSMVVEYRDDNNRVYIDTFN